MISTYLIIYVASGFISFGLFMICLLIVGKSPSDKPELIEGLHFYSMVPIFNTILAACMIIMFLHVILEKLQTGESK